MPKKADRRKGRRTRTIGGGNSAPSTSQQANVSNKGSPTPRGRTTRNSQRGRKPPRPTPPPPPPKRGNNRGGRRIKNSAEQPIFFTSESGKQYKPGDFAYVDSQQPDMPYHICRILSFKMARKESMMAEVKWFYRVSELHEPLYLMLMEDRKHSTNATAYESHQVRERELFAAFNIDTHPAALFRGKCVVKPFEEVVPNLESYMTNDDHFFFELGYKPDSRHLTNLTEEVLILNSQQPSLPDCTKDGGVPENSNVPDRYGSSDKVLDTPVSIEEVLWEGNRIQDPELLMYVRTARSIALHAGVCMTGMMSDGYMAASSDETTQYAFDMLHRNRYSTEKSLVELVRRPIVGRLARKKNWNKEHSLLFAKGMRQFGKNFYKIKKELLPEKGIAELVEYYYYWKKTTAGLSSRSTRKQRKQIHIRHSRAMLKPKELTPEREFIDLSSADEDDMEEDTESFHACRHCFSAESINWHHAGADKAILCVTCRLHYRKYGNMKPLSEKREPPNFMFKDFHESLAMEEGGRKTRNSNGVRLSAHPRLRNGKAFSKSDSDDDEDDEEEGEASDSTDSSSYSCDVPSSVDNPKGVQSRRSMLCPIEKNKDSLPSAKRPKLAKEAQDSAEENGSESTTNGEGEGDSGSQKSADHKSLSSSVGSPSSSASRDEEDDTVVTASRSVPSAISTKILPLEPAMPENALQQFKRVASEPASKSTCARTDLIYIHPPPEERRAMTATTKNYPPPFPVQPVAAVNAGASSSSAAPVTAGSSSSSQPPQQVPMITPHAPQLPAGPGAPLGLPFPVNAIQDPRFPSAEVPVVPHSGFYALPEEGLQQHLLALALAQQQGQHVNPALIQAMMQPHPGGLSVDPAQPGVIFQFPSAEEVTRHHHHHQQQQQQKLAPHIAIPEGFALMAQPFHQLAPGIGMEAAVAAGVRQQQDEQQRHQHHIHPQVIPVGTPMFHQMEMHPHQLQLLQQQQQQQLLQHGIRGAAVAAMPDDNIMRHEQLQQELLKDPNNPQLLQLAQAQAAQYMQAMMSVEQQQQLQQQLQLQELFRQQEMLKQQQQQKFTPAALRPGVIMQPK